MMRFWTLLCLIFLLVSQSAFCCTPVSDCSLVGVASKTLEGCFSLAELQCAMDLEYDAVVSGKSIREPPYEYKVCPDENVSCEQPLTPRLNRTKILCASTSSCLVSAQVQLIQQDVQVTFQDLIFDGTEGKNASVVASAPAGSIVTFINCTWKNQPQVLDIFNDTISIASNSSSPRISLMHINLLNCVIEDFDSNSKDEETFGIRSFGGSLTIRNLNVNNYNVSRFLDLRYAANVYIEDSIFTNSFMKDPRGYNDFIFADSSVLSVKNVTAMNNKVSNFCWLQGGAFAEVKNFYYSTESRSGHVFRLTSANGLFLKDSELRSEGFIDTFILISEAGPTLEVKGTIFHLKEPKHAIWSYSDVSISDSCLYGSSKKSPFLLSNGSQLSYHNVFNEVKVPEKECDGAINELVNNNQTCTKLDGTTDCRPIPTAYPPAPTCFIDSAEGTEICPIVPSIGKCASTLLELRCIMCGEASAVANGAVLRNPPFTYTLCPNKTYSITDESKETIFPIMNNTQVVCGHSPLDSCVVEFGQLQVEVGPQRSVKDVRAFQNFDLNHVEFHRIQFRNALYNEDYLITPSIWNHGRDNNVIFENCTWTGKLGSHLLVNGGASSHASDVDFVNCQIQNLSMTQRETALFLSRSGKISILKTAIEDSYLAGGLASLLEDSTLSWMDSSLIDCNTSTDFITLSSSQEEASQIAISNVLIQGNNYGESFLKMFGSAIASIQDSQFISNHGVKIISIVASALIRPVLSISSSKFANEMLQDGVLVAIGADVEVRDSTFRNISVFQAGVEASQNTKLDLSFVCFLEGSYNSSIISVDGTSSLFSEQINGDGIDFKKSTCDGILYQKYEEDDFQILKPECTSVEPSELCKVETMPTPSTRKPTSQPTIRSSFPTAMPTPFSFPFQVPFPTEAPQIANVTERLNSAAQDNCSNWSLAYETDFEAIGGI